MTKEEYIAFLNYERNMSPTVRKTFEQLIQEHFDLKEKYSKILDDVHDYRYETHCMKMTVINLCEHFGVKDEKELQNIYLNKPYTFEELKPDMWVWDDKEKVCYQIGIDEDTKERVYYFFDDGLFDTQFAYPLEFEENRFYPPNKANEGK